MENDSLQVILDQVKQFGHKLEIIKSGDSPSPAAAVFDFSDRPEANRRAAGEGWGGGR